MLRSLNLVSAQLAVLDLSEHNPVKIYALCKEVHHVHTVLHVGVLTEVHEMRHSKFVSICFSGNKAYFSNTLVIFNKLSFWITPLNLVFLILLQTNIKKKLIWHHWLFSLWETDHLFQIICIFFLLLFSQNSTNHHALFPTGYSELVSHQKM